MSQMQLVNLRLPRELGKAIEKKALKEYLSEGEFVRSSIIKMLLRFEILPQATLIDLMRRESRERMKARKGAFNKVEEIKALKRIREKVYHEKSSS